MLSSGRGITAFLFGTGLRVRNSHSNDFLRTGEIQPRTLEETDIWILPVGLHDNSKLTSPSASISSTSIDLSVAMDDPANVANQVLGSGEVDES